MSRLFVLFLVVLAAGLFLLPFMLSVQAAQSPDVGPVYRLNSEGDEMILVNPDVVEPRPSAPSAVAQGEKEEAAPIAPVAYLPGPDTRFGIELDRARQAGPQAVLLFIANQPDPHQPLLEAAARDAQNDMKSNGQTLPSAPGANRVSLNGGPCAYATIQAAVTAAAAGDTVCVSAGVYTETVDIAGKVLTIEGGYDAACTTLAGGLTRLYGSSLGSVIDLTGASVVSLRNLDLTGGNGFGGGLDLLGTSRVTLSNTDIHGNQGPNGAGIYIGSSTIVTYTNDSDIYQNMATGNGGGAVVYGRLAGYDTTSDIYSNSAVNGGGIAVFGGVVYLDNSDVIANTASGLGGGFYVVNSTVTLANSVFVGEISPCCQSAATGGGIYASASQINLVGAATSVVNNTATGNGGGLYLVNGSKLWVTGGSLGHDSSSTAGNDAQLGAGMYVMTSTVDFSGRIINNIATESGGGLYAVNSTITMTNATVGSLAAYQHNQIGPTGLNGAGMYLVNNTHATLENTAVVSNTLSNSGTGYAGGIYVRNGSVLTMTNSRIERHFLPSIGDGRGAGLYIFDATVTLSNTQVLSNTASTVGGGARLYGLSTLNVLGGSSFTDNKALNGEGGAIAATNTPDINATGAVFMNNSAAGNGGAIFLDAGTLDFNGAWDVRLNNALGNGGAVAASGTSNIDFHATGPGGSYLALNHANGNGGALYVSNADTVQLYATSGTLLALNNNSAGGNGGFAYANGGAFFDVYGKIQATANSAAGNGGVFFLSGSSRLWLDDYFNDLPQILVNTAARGGAIYASNSPRLECDGVEFGYTNDGNKATAGSGGALFLSGSTFLANNCLFRNNQAQAGNGGAIAAYTSTLTIDADYPTALHTQDQALDRSSPDMPLATTCDPLLRQCSSLYLNTSTGYGGAVFANDSKLTLSNTYLHRNTAQRGGAIYQEGASALGSISNTLVYSNTSLQAYGAGIRVAAGAMTVTQVTIANNTGGAGFSSGGGQSHIYNTIIWGNTVASYSSLTTVVCNIDQGGTAGLALNPWFLAPGAGENYHLRPSSPAANACSTGLARDLDNVARPIGPMYDMGSYEAPLAIYLPIAKR
jgi:fibronectin-binding autotransporter adhesin